MTPKERRERREGKRAQRAAAKGKHAELQARRQGNCDVLARRLTSAGWSNVRVTFNAAGYAVGGTDPQGRERSGCRMDGPGVVAELIGQGEAPLYGERPQPAPAAAPAAAPAPAPTPAGVPIEIAGERYMIVEADVKRITGAMFAVLARKDGEVLLESGQRLPVTRKTSNAIAAALAAL